MNRVAGWAAAHTGTRALAAFALAAAMLLGAMVTTTPAVAQEPGAFVGELPTAGGVGIVLWTGGTIDQLEDAAPGATSFWVTSGGQFVGYIPGAPGFVNAEFVALFPGNEIPAQTPMVVVYVTAQPAVDFSETGNLVRDVPGLEPGAWHLVYEEPGAPALTVRLDFTAQTQCTAGGAAVSCDALTSGLRVAVEGMRSDSAVQVATLDVLAVSGGQPTSALVYFFDDEAVASGQEPLVVGVERLLAPPAVAQAALDALFAGPTASEQAAGLRLIASEATGAAVMRIEDGVAHVQLQGGCDSGGSTFTVAQAIIPTLTQFASVDFVKIYDPDGTTEEPAGASNSIPVCLEP